MYIQKIHELIGSYLTMSHLNQIKLYQCSYFNFLPCSVFSIHFDTTATITVKTTAVRNRMNNSGQTGIPSGIKTTVSSITAWHDTRKISANIVSFFDTPSSFTA